MTEAAIRERAERAIEEKVFPGCVVGAVHRSGRRLAVPCGALTYESGTEPVTAETVYDLASVTKSVVTASLASLFLSENAFALSDRVSSFLPELQNHFDATIEDLLRYRVRGLRLSTLAGMSPEDIRSRALGHGFDGPPGERDYANLPALLLGFIIEAATGETLVALADRRIFAPLGMKTTTYFPRASECAPTEIDARGSVQGLPHDESAYEFAKAGKSAGHAGLFSTMPDLLAFCEALLSGRFPEIARDAQTGLGWQTEGYFLGNLASSGSYGKTGFTGTSIAVDPKKGIAWVILSNRTYPHRPADKSAINAFSSDIADILLQSVLI